MVYYYNTISLGRFCVFLLFPSLSLWPHIVSTWGAKKSFCCKKSVTCMSKSHVMSLKPCTDVNMLFTQLVLKCMPPSPIDVTKLCKRVQKMRSKLIKLCGKAEGLLESHYSTILGLYESPLDHLNIFPYYSIYLKLSLLEFTILSQNYTHVPKKIAFIGSGPLPLTSIVLASSHI